MTEQIFMRPGWAMPARGQMGHLQLFNPPDSGHLARLRTIKVSPIIELTIGYGTGPIFEQANFTESRGLPLNPDQVQQYAVCHVRYSLMPTEQKHEFGMLEFIRSPGQLTVLRDEYVLAPGRSLILRSAQALVVSFVWTEEPVK